MDRITPSSGEKIQIKKKRQMTRTGKMFRVQEEEEEEGISVR